MHVHQLGGSRLLRCDILQCEHICGRMPCGDGVFVLRIRTDQICDMAQDYNNGKCVRELQALVARKPPQGVLVRGHAGLVINKLSQELQVTNEEHVNTSAGGCRAVAGFLTCGFALTKFAIWCRTTTKGSA